MTDDREDGDPDDEDDPFAEFEDLGSDDPDDEDDPFVGLGGPTDDAETGRSGSGTAGSPGATDDPDPFEAPETSPDEPGATTPDHADSAGEADPHGGAAGDDPLTDLDADPGGAATEEDVFEAVDVDDDGLDRVWEELDDPGSVADSDAPRDRTYATVSKHRFCERCEHFSEPPDVHCTHEGTRIVEFPDMERVVVVDCPVVAERRRLGDVTRMDEPE